MVSFSRTGRLAAVRSLFLLLGLLAFAPLGHAQRRSRFQLPPPLGGGVSPGPAGIARDGDTPLTTLRTRSGRIGVFVQGIPYSSSTGTAGTFTVTGIPDGAEVLDAWLMLTSFGSSAPSIDVTFDGVPLGFRAADVQDSATDSTLICSLYRIDVTALVPGNGEYPYMASGHSNNYGDALVVLYQHESLPHRTIVVNDGAESLAFATTTTTFEAGGAGPAELTLFVEADNESDPEAVRLNGELVSGPADLFAANLGPAASIVRIPVFTSQYLNTLEIETSDDWLGIHLAILSIETSSVVIDFETEDDGATPLVNGYEFLGAEFGTYMDVHGLSASGLGAAIFDSDPAGPNAAGGDPDLLVDLGNVVILQGTAGQSIPGIFDVPNDDRDGGVLTFEFHGTVVPRSIDLVDVCSEPGRHAAVTLFDGGGNQRIYTVPPGWTEDLAAQGPPGYRTLDLCTLEDQPGFLATATAFEAPGFDGGGVVRLEVAMLGSGAVDNLVFDPVELDMIVDFEDLGIPPGGSANMPPLAGFESGGFVLEPTPNSSFLDVHAGSVILWPYNRTTIVAGHDEILMRRVDGGPFTLKGFDFAGFLVHQEVPFSLIASTGATAHFVPDGLVDGRGGVRDFESFTLLGNGFQDVTSVLFVHTGPGTDFGSFALDDLRVRVPHPGEPRPGAAPRSVRPDPTDPFRVWSRTRVGF